jgi:uncharacterized protein
MKYLLLIVVIVIVLAVMVGRRRSRPRAGRSPGAPEGMVRCAHCGIHLPRSEALLQAGRTYCSVAHLEQDRSS